MMSDSVDYDGFEKLIRDLWPEYKFTPTMLREIWNSVKKFSADTLAPAMRSHRFDEPDNVRPSWKAIKNELYAKNKGESLGMLPAHIAKCRAQLEREWQVNAERCRMSGWRPIAEWSDQEVWENFLESNTRPITHYRAGDGWRAHEDDPGRRAKCAKEERRGWVLLWYRKLDQAGDSIPPWILYEAKDCLAEMV